jgi:tRNA-specific 2-thiouridylase
MSGIAKSRYFLDGPPKKIAIALSGGVDSSVVAYLMKEQLLKGKTQNELLAVHMSNWNPGDEEDPYCTQEVDWIDAQAVSRHLDIPLQSTSFASEYWTQVFEPFSEGVEKGSRPNPDVQCNRYIKFGALRDFAQSTLNADCLATGHYARLWDRINEAEMPETLQQMLEENQGSPDWIRSWGDRKSDMLTPLLLAARDRSKCQSFFLSSVPGRAFQNVIFPLGDLIKKNKNQSTKSSDNLSNSVEQEDLTVRELAIGANLPTASKKDSMGICFIGKRPGGFTDFIDQYFPTVETQPYQFVDVDTGKIVENEFGESTTNHMVYTRGQRAKISGRPRHGLLSGRIRAHTPSLYAKEHTMQPCIRTPYTSEIYIGLLGICPPP